MPLPRPLVPKILAVLVVGYFLSPIDLIPDFIPVLAECRAKAKAWLAEHKPTPRSITAAVVIMLLWMTFFGTLWTHWGDELLKWLATH